MSHSDSAIHASYVFCRDVARRAGSSFYPSFLLLPKPKRRAMAALYAFMRYTDDVADNPQPVDVRREALARWRTSLEAALSGEGRGKRGEGRGASHEGQSATHEGRGTSHEGQWATGEGRSTRHGPSISNQQSSTINPSTGEALLPALAHTVQQFRIPAGHLVAVVDGVAMDLDRPGYETFDDLVAYCERVASAVGLACIHVWGFRSDEAFEPARKCGIALQLTNILRDLKEDAEQGRVYVPREDLRRWGYSVEDLGAGVVDERFQRLMAFQIDRARRFYREGAGLFDWLHPDGRRAFGMIMTVYHRLLDEIARRPGEVFRRRVGLSRWQKLGIAARWALLPARRSALP